jgi:hypothetical protein
VGGGLLHAAPPGSKVRAAAAAADLETDLIDDVAGFFDDPLGFVRYAYPWGEDGTLKDEAGPDEWQTRVLNRIGAAVRCGATVQEAIRVAIASGHGIGKTCLIAWVVQWFISTREFPQVVVTASTQTQLSTKTWRELAKWWRLSINRHWFTWTATKFYHVAYPDSWFATAIPWSEHNADAFAGTHEKYVLIIYDEGNAIADVIYDTTEGALTTPSALWLVFGNYTKNTGRFHECFAGRMRDRWLREQIDSRTARKANQRQIAQWIEDYGEDSDFVRIRVRGVAPRAGSNQFIGQDLLDRGYRAVGWETAPKIMSLDVARFGDNQSVVGLRQGRRFRLLAKWRGLAIDQLVDRVCALLDEQQPDALVVDGDGIGGAAVDLIRRRNYGRKGGRDIITEFHGGARAHDGKTYDNRRTEIWGLAREALKEGIELPADQELEADLVGPQYGYVTKQGYEVIQLEKKDDMRSRGLASPDSGDAFAMCWAVRVQAAPKRARAVRAHQIGDPGLSWMGA